MNRDGMGLIEVIVGMIILTVGVLAMVASTTFVQMQLWSADMRTERSVARQQVVEALRSEPFDSITTRSQGDAVTQGSYTLWWDATLLRWELKEVQMYTQGPAVVNGKRLTGVVDTMTFRIARLIQ